MPFKGRKFTDFCRRKYPSWRGLEEYRRSREERDGNVHSDRSASTEIDVLGHVNNAKYLEYLEWGREDWYNRIGLPFEAFSEMGVGTVTVNININYRKEARLGEKLTIRTRPLRKGKSSFVLEQYRQRAGGAGGGRPGDQRHHRFERAEKRTPPSGAGQVV